MRDPKTHAKVLAKRHVAVCGAQLQAVRDGDEEWLDRLAALAVLILATIEANREDTEWEYITWTVPPHWRHTEIIPDTEEEA